ncbi:MAG: SlyX family protein [Treponema sp.]|nr:SlyX family protein [Treponema sp.]
MTDEELDKRFIDLETKFAYLEDFVQKLQEVTVEYSREIDKLKFENKLMAEKMEDLANSEEIPNRKPPHY